MSSKVKSLISDTTSTKWSELKNRTGSLLLPSDELVTSIHLFDSVFMEIHGKDISRENDPMGETKHVIMKAKNRWPRSVVKMFLKIRVFQ